MKVTEAEIQERLPVWHALSEFFLDTSLQTNDYDRIANRLAASKYSMDEIEEILIFEVRPVCRWNMLSIAGEWVDFGEEWLREKISPLCGRRSWLKPFFLFMNRWDYPRHWNKVSVRISDFRSKRPSW